MRANKTQTGKNYIGGPTQHQMGAKTRPPPETPQHHSAVMLKGLQGGP